MGAGLLLRVALVLWSAGGLWACGLKNFTLYVERQECGYCMAINTTICNGLCYTQDSNMRSVIGGRLVVQRACVYQASVYAGVEMPGCPLYVYPVALRCHCTKCNTVRNECVQRSRRLLTRCPAKPPAD